MAGFGTEFVSMLSPPGDSLRDYVPGKRHREQPATLPQTFRDAMVVREEVFVDEQGVPLENEVDEDDKRSWHWVAYASVCTTSSPPPDSQTGLPHPAETSNNSAAESGSEDERRSSASAISVPIGTIRLVPPPHPPNPYINHDETGGHPDARPPPGVAESIKRKTPTEPYIKLGRLASAKDFRKMGISRLLINTAIEYASKNPKTVCPPPSPTTVELAKVISKDLEEAAEWKGLCMVHAQVSVKELWARQGFVEELTDEKGEVVISKEEHWIEEDIEHLAMWKRIKLDPPRL